MTARVPDIASLIGELFDVRRAPDEASSGASFVLGVAGTAEPLVLVPSGPVNGGVDGGFGGGGDGGGDGARGQAEIVLGALPESVCLVTSEGVPVWTNQGFTSLETSTKERVIAACADASRVFGDRKRVKAGRLSVRRLDVVSGDGDLVYEVIVSPAPGTGREGDVVAVVRDVTSARQLARKIDAIDAAGAALVRLDADEIRKMDAMKRLGLLEEKIVRNFKELLHHDHFVIRLIDDRTGRLEPVMSANIPQEAIELELYPRTEGNGICGYVSATGRDYICYDTSKDERYLPGAESAKSSLTVPLRIDDEIIGALDIESTQVGAFNEQDRRVATIFARYIAIALKMLDLLVVERSATNATVSDRFADEIEEPLADILREAEEVETRGVDPATVEHLRKIKADVASIRSRMESVAKGRHTLLGLDRMDGADRVDPVLDGCRALVIDDDDQIREIICDLLRRRGCDVRSANTGQAGIDAIEHAASKACFDVVVSDISLPDRNGYEVFSAARDASDRTAVILMTGFGYDPHHSIVRASQRGLEAVLFKPFQAKRLVDEVRAAVLKHAGSGA